MSFFLDYNLCWLLHIMVSHRYHTGDKYTIQTFTYLPGNCMHVSHSLHIIVSYRSVPCTQLTGVWGLIVKDTMHALVPVYDKANSLNSLYIAASYRHVLCMSVIPRLYPSMCKKYSGNGPLFIAVIILRTGPLFIEVIMNTKVKSLHQSKRGDNYSLIATSKCKSTEPTCT